MQLLKKIRADHCPVCEKDRVLKLYDQNNNDVKYTLMIDSGRLEMLGRRQLSHFTCSSCKKEFKIDWSNKSEPRALTDLKMQDFMRNYQ